MDLYFEQEKKFKQKAVFTQLNVIPLLANVVVLLNKPEAVDLIIPLFVESLSEGDASVPSLMRLKVRIDLQVFFDAQGTHAHILVCRVPRSADVYLNLACTVCGAGT